MSSAPPRNARGRALIYHVVLCLASIAMLYPLLWMLASSFKPDSDIFGSASLWPRNFSLDAYWRGWSGLQVTLRQVLPEFADRCRCAAWSAT